MPSTPSIQGSRGDGWVKRLLVMFVLVSCVQAWVGPIPFAEPASAQIPDSLAQRRELLRMTQQTNQLLTELLAVVKTGTINVRIADEKTKSPARSRPPRSKR